MNTSKKFQRLLGLPFWTGCAYLAAIALLSANLLMACFKEDPYPRKECQACEVSSDCCCGLSCRDFIVQGGPTNGLPVKRCAGANTTTCPN